MKLLVKDKNKRIFLWLPNIIFKSRFGYFIAKQALKSGVKSELGQQKNMPISREQLLAMYETLWRVINDKGHFNLVEVESVDGSKILIRV